MKKLLIIGLAVLGLTACSPEPVKYTQKGKEKASFHMENDDILEAGIREVTKGVYLRKFKIGNDTIYMRCDKDGNILHLPSTAAVGTKDARFVNYL